MYYAIYKTIRESAWQCLLDFELFSLPIDILKITRAANIKVVENSRVHDLEPNEYGKSYFDGKRWTIIYDDMRDVPTARFTIAHELGHIFLGHALTYTKYENVQQFCKRPKAEQQADMFALRLLCPACILKELGAISVADIVKLCSVPPEQAKIRHDRMLKLVRRDKFLSSKLEREVYHNFSGFLLKEIRKKEKLEKENEAQKSAGRPTGASSLERD